MPELPDVKGFQQILVDYAVGKQLSDVVVKDESVLTNTSGRAFRRALREQHFTDPVRHGRWLIAPLAGSDTNKTGTAGNAPAGHVNPRTYVVLFHFGMTGELTWATEEQQAHRHDRILFRFGDGELRYRDMRKLKGPQTTVS